MSGKLLIFSAPSGSGKTTLVQYLLKTIESLEFSISATTRQPRGNEIDGQDYYFLTNEDFENKIQKDEFVEWEEVYKGTYYGTLKYEVERIWEKGNHVIFDMDVVGGLNLKKIYADKALSIYVDTLDFQQLETRIRNRNTETEEKIQERLAKAKHEMGFKNQFEVVILNNEISVSSTLAKNIALEFLGK